MNDMVNHPKHYTQASVPLEPIDVLRYAPFDLGNCLKYLIRAGHKDDALQDLKKADYYFHCADESSDANPAQYSDFLKHYGLLLTKFKVFEHVIVQYGVGRFLDCLESIINERIKECV